MAEFIYEPLPDLEAYLARIGYTGSRELSRENLNELVYCHQCSVPFENLSCCDYGEPVVMDIPSLYDKVVTRHRGGYCFELNGIFAALLRAFGFDAYSVMCRLARSDEIRPVMHRRCGHPPGRQTLLLRRRLRRSHGSLCHRAIPQTPDLPRRNLLDRRGPRRMVSRQPPQRRRQRHRRGQHRRARGCGRGLFSAGRFHGRRFCPLSYQCSSIPTSGFRHQPLGKPPHPRWLLEPQKQ